MTNEELYSKIVDITKSAGGIILKAHIDNDSVYDKEGYSNFVTKYDKEVQNHLISHFKDILPEASYLAEEDNVTSSLGNGYCFIIDPIDGTTNFIFDYKNSCISVALANCGKVEFAVVYLPYMDECYTAIQGRGAYLNGKRIYASQEGLNKNVVAFGCARYNSDDTDRIFSLAKELYLSSLAIRNGGSSTIDLCRVASGRNGIYIELLLMPWDYAAASLIITEAGGVITQLGSEEITLDKPCGILAGGELCHNEAMKIIQSYTGVIDKMVWHKE